MAIDHKLDLASGSPSATCTRDLTDLVSKNALFKKGELKHTRYFLNLDE